MTLISVDPSSQRFSRSWLTCSISIKIRSIGARNTTMLDFGGTKVGAEPSKFMHGAPYSDLTNPLRLKAQFWHAGTIALRGVALRKQSVINKCC